MIELLESVVMIGVGIVFGVLMCLPVIRSQDRQLSELEGITPERDASGRFVRREA